MIIMNFSMFLQCIKKIPYLKELLLLGINLKLNKNVKEIHLMEMNSH